MSIFSLMRLFTIRFRMLSAIGVVLVLLGMLGGVGMWGMFRIHALSEDFAARSFVQQVQIAELQTRLGAARSAHKDMQIQQSAPESVSAARLRAVEGLVGADQAVARFLGAPGAATDSQALALRQGIAAYRNLIAQMPGVESDTAWATLQEGVGTLQAQAQRGADAAVQAQAKALEQAQWLFALLVVVTVLVVAPLTLLNMIAILRPLARAREVAHAIAQGDLSQPVLVNGRDEVADLQRALREMQGGLSTLVAQVRDASGSLAMASQ